MADNSTGTTLQKQLGYEVYTVCGVSYEQWNKSTNTRSCYSAFCSLNIILILATLICLGTTESNVAKLAPFNCRISLAVWRLSDIV